MQYTFLIHKQNGKIRRFQPTGNEAWLKKETEDKFELHVLEVENEEMARMVQKDCRYDSELGFVYQETGDPFEIGGAVTRKTNFSDDDQKNAERTEMVTGEPTEDSGIFITPHRPRFTETRKYWLKAAFSHRKNPQVNSFLEAVKYGCYGHIFERFEQIDSTTQEQILDSVSDADRVWADYWLLRGPKPE